MFQLQGGALNLDLEGKGRVFREIEVDEVIKVY